MQGVCKRCDRCKGCKRCEQCEPPGESFTALYSHKYFYSTMKSVKNRVFFDQFLSNNVTAVK